MNVQVVVVLPQRTGSWPTGRAVAGRRTAAPMWRIYFEPVSLRYSFASSHKPLGTPHVDIDVSRR